MPTGYTAALAEGEQFTRDFLIQACRGLGVAITMRDDDWNNQIPREFEPSDYHQERMTEIKQEIAELEAMPADAAAILAKQEYDSRNKSDYEYIYKQRAQRDRYNQALADVKKLMGLPEGIKEFAIQQLESSINFDCSSADKDPEEYAAEWRKPISLDGEQYIYDQVAEKYKDLKYHSEQYAEEVKRTKSRNEWLRQFWKVIDEQL